MENRLLEQYNTSIKDSWKSESFNENYPPLNHRELFEIAYHTSNSVASRTISLKLSQDENKGGSKAILYSSSSKTFKNIEALDGTLNITIYSNDDSCSESLNNIKPKVLARKENYASKENDVKIQILKTILVERKLDECANLVMLNDKNRKVYFAIGDARESAAVVPMFMEAEGASLVQLALNKWMTTAQRLPQEENFPKDHIGGILKNLTQIKKWLLTLVSNFLDK